MKHAAPSDVVFAIVAALDLDMIQLDIKTAFLYGTHDENIYMEQPEGFIQKGWEKEVCHLVKSIYGLKQAPRVWTAKFNEFLLKFGLTRSTADPCVYFRRQEEEITIVAIFVDDGLVCSNKKENLTSILEHLSTTFEMRSFPAHRFVDLDISRDRQQRQLFIFQPHFIAKLLEKFQMDQCNPKSVPAGLSFGSSDLKDTIGYTDADYAGDTKTRRSISGFVFLLHGGPISWTSRQQTCTSLSTTEAEFLAASEASKEAIWLKRHNGSLFQHSQSKLPVSHIKSLF